MEEKINQESKTGEEEKLTKHELKELKRLKRDEEKRKEEEKVESQKKRKKIITYGVIGVIVLLAGYFIYLMIGFFGGNKDGDGNEGPYTKDVIHWHAQLDVFACGERKLMPIPFPGQGHLGSPLLHTHEDRLIHIEGKIWSKDDIKLGKYMDAIGVEFSNDTVLDYKNGNMCDDGKENKVKMFVNGKENFEFRDYVIGDGDKIEVRYE